MKVRPCFALPSKPLWILHLVLTWHIFWSVAIQPTAQDISGSRLCLSYLSHFIIAVGIFQACYYGIIKGALFLALWFADLRVIPYASHFTGDIWGTGFCEILNYRAYGSLSPFLFPWNVEEKARLISMSLTLKDFMGNVNSKYNFHYKLFPSLKKLPELM